MRRGFLIGVIVFVVVVVGGVVGFYLWDRNYHPPHRSPEARQRLLRIYDAAKSYYAESGVFPGPSVPVTPPLGRCCEQGGKCEVDAAQWIGDTWVTLMFSMDDPHLYSYSYTVSDDRQQYTAHAFGDLDCDGIYSTFEINSVDRGKYGGPTLRHINELE